METQAPPSVITIDSSPSLCPAGLKEQFLEIYSSGRHPISDAVLEPLFTAHPECRDELDVAGLLRSVSQRLETKLRGISAAAWDEMELSSVASAEQKTPMAAATVTATADKHVDGNNWRASGKTADEQMLPELVWLWEAKNEDLKRKIEQKQVPVLEELLSTVEKRREQLRQRIDQRQRTMQEMQAREQQMLIDVKKLTDKRAELLRKQMDIGA